MINSTFRLVSFSLKVGCFVIFFNFWTLFSQQHNNISIPDISNWKYASFEELTLLLEEEIEEMNLLELQEISNLMHKKASEKEGFIYVVKIYYLLAEAYKRSDNYQFAIKSIDTAINHFYVKIPAEQKIKIYLLKASLLFDIGAYNKAIENNLRILQLAKKDKNHYAQLLVNHNIAMIKYQTNNVKGALKIYKANRSFIKNDTSIKNDIEKQHFFITTLIAMIDASIDLEEFDNAIIYSSEVIRYSEIFGHYQYKAYGFLGLSNVYSLTSKCEKALINLTKAEGVGRDNLDLNFHSSVHLYRARTYFEQDLYMETITELNKINKDLEKGTSDIMDDHEINVLYAKSYQRLNDLKHASTYFNKAFDLFEDNKKRIRTVNTSLTEEYDTNYLKEEIETWSSFAKKQKQKFQIATLCAILLLCSFLIFNRHQKKKNKKKYKAVIEELNKETAINSSDDTVVTDKKEISVIETKKVNELLKKLKIFETEEWFLDSNSSLNEVAKKLKTNTSYLSKVINQHKKKTFIKYLTELRLDYAMNRLKNDTKFRSYTIKSIAQEIGFHSSEPFAKAFKKKTGIYPSYFIRALEDN